MLGACTHRLTSTHAGVCLGCTAPLPVPETSRASAVLLPSWSHMPTDRSQIFLAPQQGIQASLCTQVPKPGLQLCPPGVALPCPAHRGWVSQSSDRTWASGIHFPAQAEAPAGHLGLPVRGAGFSHLCPLFWDGTHPSGCPDTDWRGLEEAPAFSRCTASETWQSVCPKHPRWQCLG